MFPQPDSSYIFDNIERYMKLFGKEEKENVDYVVGYLLYEKNGRKWGVDGGLGLYLFTIKEHALGKQKQLHADGEKNWIVGEFKLYKTAEYHASNSK